MHNKNNLGNTLSDSFSKGLWIPKIIIEKLPFISNTGSDCAVCFNIDCSGMGRRGL